jgi:hypothetical protein
LELEPEVLFTGIKATHILTNDLFVFIAVKTLCSGVTGGNPSIRVKQEQRVVFDPGRGSIIVTLLFGSIVQYD